MRHSERGASAVPLVISIMLLVGVAGWGYNEMVNRETAEAKLNDVLREASDGASLSVETAKKLIREGKKGPPSLQRLQELTDIVGGVNDADSSMGPDPARVKEILEKFMTAIDSGDLTIEFPVDHYVDAGDGNIKVTRGAETMRVSYGGERELKGQAKTYVNVFDRVIVPALQRMAADIKRYAAALDAEKKAKDAAAEAYAASLRAKDEEITRKNSEQAALQQSKADEVATVRNERDAAQTRASQAEQDRDTKVAELQKSLADQTRVANQRHEEVQVLKARQRVVVEDTSPDGEIVGVGEHQSSIVINRGKADNLQPGTNFEVYGEAKGGRIVVKGNIKATMVGDTTSQCAVLDRVDLYEPIVAGDKIRSKTYDPKHTYRFVLAGRFQRMGRSDAAARLTSLGAVVQDKVDLDTDYVVLGAPEDENQPVDEMQAVKDAKMLGITVITERELANFTRY